MSEVHKKPPYSHLGSHLKAMRAKAKESLVEVSGAVEIDVMQLATIEKGLIRPSEDILLLLISHFGAKEKEAVHLWEMAGYGTIKTIHSDNKVEEGVLYTDSVDVVAGVHGLVMNFKIDTEGKPKNLARLGMSREHAQKIAEAIIETLNKTDQQ